MHSKGSILKVIQGHSKHNSSRWYCHLFNSENQISIY